MAFKVIVTLIMLTQTLKCFSSELFHHPLNADEKRLPSYIWERKTAAPFDELIVSWNAQRPQTGAYLIQLSVFTQDWSPWLDYAWWSSSDQRTYKQQHEGFNVRTFQDALECLNEAQATGFRIRIEVQDMKNLNGMLAWHACTTDLKNHHVDCSKSFFNTATVELPIPKISQMALPDKRNIRLCSPTSTTAVVKYLSQSALLQPVTFANTVKDTFFDIYGNWILNTAQASHHLGPHWQCYVARLTSFDQILDRLEKGFPVIVSVQGPLEGSAQPYSAGHLMVVRGFDPASQMILCMDPAFPTDIETYTAYPLEDFLTAWNRRKGIAYIFDNAINF